VATDTPRSVRFAPHEFGVPDGVAESDARTAQRTRAGDAAADQTSPSVEVADAEATAAVRRAVDDLPSARAGVVRCVRQEGLTPALAGARTDRSAGAARKLCGGRAPARPGGEVDDPEDDRR
jgi:DNA-directed RNA polymerase specialized sigma24 family protein